MFFFKKKSSRWPCMCCCQFALMAAKNQKQMHLACLTPNPKWVICLLPAKTFTGILLMYPLYRGQEVPCNMLSYLFSCCEAIPTLPVPLFRLLPVYSCVQSVHIPKSTAKNTTPQLWTLITFFGWVVWRHIFGKVLYIYQYHSPKNCSFFAHSQKS